MKLSSPPKRLHEPVQIVRNEEAVLPGVGLGVVVVHTSRIERLEPPLIAPRAHEARLGVQKMTPALAAPEELAGNLVPSHSRGHPGDAPVVVGVLQRPGDRLGGIVTADEALAPVGVEAEVILVGTVDHRPQGRLRVESPDTLEPGVGDDRDGVIADHGVGLVGGQFPDRKPAALLVLGKERLDELACPLRLDEVQTRMRGAKGVPEREDRVLVSVRRPVKLPVHPPVTAVHVRVEIRRQETVVESRVEDGPLGLGAPLDPDVVQGLVPATTSLPANGVKVPTWKLGIQVAPRPLEADGR
jgi:hypothetical protein